MFRKSAVVLALLLITAACGGSDDADTTTTTATTTTTTTTTTLAPSGPTKAEFIAMADPICSELQDQFDDTALDSDVTLEEIIALISGQVVPALRVELDELEALDRPTEDAAEIESMLSAFETGIDAVEADPISLLAGDPLATAQERALDYGLAVCGSAIIPELPADVLPPAEFTADEQAVADVIEEFYDPETSFDRGLELLADRERVEATLAASAADPATAALSSIVTDVAFPDEATCQAQGLDPGCAAATHDFLIGTAVLSPGNVSYLILEDGAWKIAADSFCAVAERGGYPCPEL